MKIVQTRNARSEPKTVQSLTESYEYIRGEHALRPCGNSLSFFRNYVKVMRELVEIAQERLAEDPKDLDAQRVVSKWNDDQQLLNGMDEILSRLPRNE